MGLYGQIISNVPAYFVNIKSTHYSYMISLPVFVSACNRMMMTQSDSMVILGQFVKKLLAFLEPIS